MRLSALALLLLPLVAFAKKSGELQIKDEVPLFVNKIGPYANPSETYSFYHLPFCKPPEIQHKHESLGEVLEGDVLQSSLYDLRFRVRAEWRSLCKVHLDVDEVKQLCDAIDQYYYFELVYDDLPLYGFIGAVENVEEDPNVKKYYLFTHLRFSISYNENRIIHANVSADQSQVVELIPGRSQVVEFSYSVEWEPTTIPYAKRKDVYAANPFFQRELEIHWMSIMNSCVLVVLLVGFLVVILYRVLKNDYTRYELKAGAESGGEDPEDYGWKLVHADVFRFPPHPSLFSALVGNGMQFLTVAFGVLLLAIVGVFYPTNKGGMQTAALVLYILTSFVSGYTSAMLYQKMSGTQWAWNTVLTSAVFSGPFFVTWSILNSIAWAATSTSALPVGTVIIIFAIFFFVGCPLTLFGSIAGRQVTQFSPPCRTKNIPREIPDIPWYRQSVCQIIMAGFLPFSAIYIELYYIFASVWGHKAYTLYGILLIVFLILIVVTACITVAMTYFQLAIEDHRWWWRSFVSGGSTGLFIYAYSIFYYHYRSEMHGTLQAWFYFGYNAMACLAVFMLLGTVGFFASFAFVYKIYSDLKFD